MESNTLIVLLSAIAPAIVLLIHTYLRDKNQREPFAWLFKGVWYGVLSAFVAMAFATPASLVLGDEMTSSMAVNTLKAFALAAVPEESAKLLCLYLLLRKNPYFDEKMDGIVYAACVGMGFAGLENIMYLMQGMESGSWMGLGISRAIFSVPAHYFFAVAMGYFFSRAWFSKDKKLGNYFLCLFVPIFLHGIYDGLLFSLELSEMHTVILGILFLVFCFRMAKTGHKRIEAHLQEDKGYTKDYTV